MLTTLGSIPPDPDLLEQDIVEMENVRFGPNADMRSLCTGEDGERLPDGERHPNATPTPTYHSLEIGFRGGSSHEDLGDLGAAQNRVDVDHEPSIV